MYRSYRLLYGQQQGGEAHASYALQLAVQHVMEHVLWYPMPGKRRRGDFLGPTVIHVFKKDEDLSEHIMLRDPSFRHTADMVAEALAPPATIRSVSTAKAPLPPELVVSHNAMIEGMSHNLKLVLDVATVCLMNRHPHKTLVKWWEGQYILDGTEVNAAPPRPPREIPASFVQPASSADHESESFDTVYPAGGGGGDGPKPGKIVRSKPRHRGGRWAPYNKVFPGGYRVGDVVKTFKDGVTRFVDYDGIHRTEKELLKWVKNSPEHSRGARMLKAAAAQYVMKAQPLSTRARLEKHCYNFIVSAKAAALRRKTTVHTSAAYAEQWRCMIRSGSAVDAVQQSPDDDTEAADSPQHQSSSPSTFRLLTKFNALHLSRASQQPTDPSDEQGGPSGLLNPPPSQDKTNRFVRQPPAKIVTKGNHALEIDGSGTSTEPGTSQRVEGILPDLNALSIQPADDRQRSSELSGGAEGGRKGGGEGGSQDGRGASSDEDPSRQSVPAITENPPASESGTGRMILIHETEVDLYTRFRLHMKNIRAQGQTISAAPFNG